MFTSPNTWLFPVRIVLHLPILLTNSLFTSSAIAPLLLLALSVALYHGHYCNQSSLLHFLYTFFHSFTRQLYVSAVGLSCLLTLSCSLLFGQEEVGSEGSGRTSSLQQLVGMLIVGMQLAYSCLQLQSGQFQDNTRKF